MSGLKTDCKKFSPNIFNKTKCQNCFRTKDAHSAEALECNRATRKVSKCGYLFVAPDWDFTVSINRTKRWQRRWFVLYDDGELTYSVDEHPDTVPQAVIDMNHVLEVADAEDITGNQFALAITAPEKVHFIKGTCRDESKWWCDVLSRYPKNTIRGKHKRNATFPGLKASLITENETKENSKIVQDSRIFANRPRFLSCNADSESQWEKGNENDDVFPVKELISDNQILSVNKEKNSVLDYLHNQFVLTENSNNTLNEKNSFEDKNSIINTTNKEDNKSLSGTTLNNTGKEKETETMELVKGQSRRYLKRESRGLKSQRSRSDGVSKMVPPLHSRELDSLGYWSGLDFRIKKNSTNSQEKNYHHNPVYLLLSDVPSMKKYESLESLHRDGHSPLLSCRRHTNDKIDLIKSLTLETKSNDQQESRKETKSDFIISPISPNQTENVNPSTKNGITLNWGKDTEQIVQSAKTLQDIETDSQVRGDPDGCGLDGISVCCTSNQENRIERNAEDIFLKKGWLMRYSVINGWCKHWFVLKNASLTYFQDPTAEESGIIDGIVDMPLVKDVGETESDRNYAFTITMCDDKKHLLSAVTGGIRNNWMQALIHVARIWSDTKKDSIIEPRVESEINTNDYSKENSNRLGISPSPAPSVEEPDKLLDVSSSDDHSEYFSVVDEGEFLCRTSSPRPLPPSPPLNRTAISRVKERARSRSSSRSRISHQFWSSSTDSQHSAMDMEQHSDGGISDHSSSSFHGLSSVNEKGMYYEHPSFLDGTDDHAVDDLINSKKLEKKQTNDFNRKNKYLEKHERSKEQKINLLEEHCRELEIQLKKKEEEIGEKSAELNNLKSLKGSYHDLVEKYNSLKKRLEDCEKKISGNNEGKSYRLKYESLRNKYKKERTEWESKLSTNRDADTNDVSYLLEQNKKQLSELKMKLEKSPLKKDSLWSTWKDSSKLCEEIESLADNEKRFKKDIEMIKLKNNIADLEVLCGTKQEELEKRKRELQKLYGNLEKKESETNSLSNELTKAVEENRIIKEKMKTIETCIPKLESQSQLSENMISHITTLRETELTEKYDRAREEIRNLKKQLKEAHNAYDELELHCYKLEQDMKGMEQLHHSQMALMTARVDDLTLKFTSSERNLRALRQKLAKVEAKQERRRSSLKGKEALNLSKEYEIKLTELEQKIIILETALQTSPEPEISCRSSTENNTEVTENSEAPSSCQKNLQKRRLSQDSGEAHGMLLRLHNLDTKVKKASSFVDRLSQSSEKPKILLQKVSDGADVTEENEEWNSLSVTASMTDLSTIDGENVEQLQSGKECLEHLSKKIKLLLSWVKSVLEYLNSQSSSSTEVGEKTDTEMSKVIGVLEHMCGADIEKLFGMSSKDEKELVTIVYNLLLIQEVARALCKLNDFEKYKCNLTRQYLERINHMLIFLEQHLNCISSKTVTENNEMQSDRSDLIKFTKKLFLLEPETENTLVAHKLEQKEIYNTLHENLKTAEQKSKTLSEMAKKFVNTKRRELGYYLVNIPTNMEHQPVSDNNQEVLLIEMSHTMAEVVGWLENQLSAIENQQISLLKYDWENFYALNSTIRKTVDHQIMTFTSEVREMILEMAENFYSTCHVKHFTNVLTEIGFVIVMNSMVVGSILFIRENVEKMCAVNKEDNGEKRSICQSVIYERFFNYAKQCLGHFHPDGINNVLCRWVCSIVDGKYNVETLTKENAENITRLRQKYKEEIERERNIYEEKLQSVLSESKNSKYECEKCLRSKLEIQELKLKLREKDSKREKNCKQCEKLTQDIRNLSKCVEDLNFAVEQEKEISKLCTEEKLAIQEKDHNNEIQKIRNELQMAQNHAQYLKEEYDKQISSLQSTYEQKLSQNIGVINEEAVRQRYHLEIEQMKCLCGNGLTAMENFHQRTIAELKRKHEEEIALLEKEKEQALAEETQATLTAIEALKKAHKAELQNEISKFKENYIKKMQLYDESTKLRREYKDELGAIRHDILSLSEKYSVKCLENASLEERITALRSQLQESNLQLFDLIARNKQLKAYLASDIQEKLSALQNDDQFDDETKKLKHLLSLQEGELTKQHEEIAHLRQELHLAQTHADILDIHCQQLDHSLKNERSMREGEIKSFKSQLEEVLFNSSSVCQDDTYDASFSPNKSSNDEHKIAITCGRELARSVSYPSLHRLPVSTDLHPVHGNVIQSAEG